MNIRNRLKIEGLKDVGQKTTATSLLSRMMMAGWGFIPVQFQSPPAIPSAMQVVKMTVVSRHVVQQVAVFSEG